MNLFVFGLGYSAVASVNLTGDFIFQNGGTISATTRSEEKREKLAAKGIRAHIYDGEGTIHDDMRDELRSATHLLLSISPPLEEAEDDLVASQFERDILENKELQWIGYYSTVGVYGDHDGKWVDENSPLKPVSRRSVARVQAEARWQKLADERDIPLAIFRLAGIYGPGRNTFLNFRNGRARRIIKAGQVFNRIHVDDIAALTKAAIDRQLGGIFNGSDDEPAPPQDVVEYAANLMGVAVPPAIPFEEADLSPMGRSFYGETKRVSNQSTKERLGLTFRYPNYREALHAMWSSNNWETSAELRNFNP